MKLPKEIDLSWSRTIALSWAFIWRMLTFSIPAALVLGYMESLGEGMAVYALLFQLVFSLIAIVVVFRWIFRDSSFGSIRLVLMEQADFQELVNRLENSKESA